MTTPNTKTEIETLTDEERHLIWYQASERGAKALRIIDARDARIAELEYANAQRALVIDALEMKLAAASESVDRHKKLVELAELSATAHRCATQAAEARVRELEADVSAAHQDHANAVNAKQQKLAAANALLGRLKESAETAIGSIELAYGGYRPDWPAAVTDAVAAFRRIALSAHLSAKPAAPTDHDRAILEAADDAVIEWVQAGTRTPRLSDGCDEEPA